MVYVKVGADDNVTMKERRDGIEAAKSIDPDDDCGIITQRIVDIIGKERLVGVHASRPEHTGNDEWYNTDYRSCLPSAVLVLLVQDLRIEIDFRR
jgi:hypothetical protein